MSHLISIIIPTFNRGDYLFRAIKSVFSQSYKNYELIIVDDGSTDNTLELLAPLIKSNEIKYYKQENSGVSSARNLGIKNSSGDLVSFLDSDDEWLPNKLQEQINFLAANPHIKIVYGDEQWIRRGIRVNQKAFHKKSGGKIFKACVEQCLIAPSSVLLQRSLIDEMGGFDDNFIVCEDYDLWLKISSTYEIGFIAHALIIKHGGHEDQLSTKYVAMDFWRLKALSNILKTRDLSPLDRTYVQDSMKHRGAILLQGYLKYNNTRDYQTVQNILSELS